MYAIFRTGGVGVSAFVATQNVGAKMFSAAAFIAALALGHNGPTSRGATPIAVQGIIGGPAVAAMLPGLSR